MKIFICGSIAIKRLNEKITGQLDEFLDSKNEILIGDADGVDSLVQEYLFSKNYTNVTIYHIGNEPRNGNDKNFKTHKSNYDESLDCKKNKERAKQTFKDERMIEDCDCCFCIWDGKSKGSYANIKKTLDKKKQVYMYYNKSIHELLPNQNSKNEVDTIYESNNGYSIREIYDLLKEDYECGKESDFKKILKDKKLIKDMSNNRVEPTDIEDGIPQLYKGFLSSYRFKESFIKKVEAILKKRSKTLAQGSLPI